MAKRQGGKQAQPYGWAEAFEKAVAFLACTEPRFFLRTAHEVQPDLLQVPEAKLAVDAAQAVHRRTGRPPAAPAVVIQEVASRREDGKVTHEEVRAVAGLFDAFDEKRPEVEEIEPAVVDALRRRIRHAIAQAAIDEHNEEEWRGLHDLLRREERLGRAEEGAGVIMTPGAVRQALEGLRKIRRVPLGIDCLDEGLLGGVPNGTLTCFMAGPGGGKSMALSHCTATQSIGGRLVAYATLEVPVPYVISRVLGCQAGLTINEILAEERALGEALAALAGTAYVPPAVQDFAPHVTTVETLTEWVKEVEDAAGRKVDTLVVDYADKLTASGKVDEKGMYQEMRVVFEKLRVWCDSNGVLGLTASQSRARDEKKSKKIDLEHVADSMHKARIVDQFITLNYDDDTAEMTFFLAKNRYGEGRKSIGPVPTNYSVGQVAPVARAVRPPMPDAAEREAAFGAAVRLGVPVQEAMAAALREPGEDDAPAAPAGGQPEGVPF